MKTFALEYSGEEVGGTGGDGLVVELFCPELQVFFAFGFADGNTGGRDFLLGFQEAGCDRFRRPEQVQNI